MAERGRSIWDSRFGGEADRRTPYGDPLATPFKPTAKVPDFGHAEQLPQILGPLQAKQQAVSRAFETGGGKPRRSDALRIFVGGALDNRIGQNTKGYYEQYVDSGAGSAEYCTHVSVPSIMGAIRRASEDGIPVDILGHSYGAMAAFNAANLAGQQDYRVRNLVTADPVGRLSTSRGPLPAGSVTRWINIDADPPSDALKDKLNLSDLVGRVGGKPSTVPTAYADQDFIVRRHHEDLAGMVRDAGVDVIFRAPADAGELSDDLDGLEWNRRREVQTQRRSAGR